MHLIILDNSAAAFLPHIEEVPISNIRSETGYLDFVVFLSSSGEFWDIVSN